jgi:hypothetical protein
MQHNERRDWRRSGSQSAISALVSAHGSKLYTARRAVEQTREHMAAMIGSAPTQDKQLKWLARTGWIALLFGLLASPVFARLLPFGLDDHVAAFIMRGNRAQAGAALLQAGAPESWHRICDEFNLIKSDQETLATCQVAALRPTRSSAVRS